MKPLRVALAVATAFLSIPLTFAQMQLTYTILDVPKGGAVSTYLNGINNNGVIVGYYGDFYHSRNFTWQDGVFSFFPGPGLGGLAYAINDSNQIVGWYSPNETDRVGFIFDGLTYTDVLFPGALYTQPYGINNAGHIVGAEEPSGGAWTGFLFDGTAYRSFEAGSTYTFASGINNLGDVVGSQTSASDTRGFIRRKGKNTPIAPPDAIFSAATAINDNGIIVGSYLTATTNSRCFISKNGKFKTFYVPDIKDTYCQGINNAGVIVGYVADFGMHVAHGFYTSPVTDADFR